MKRVLVILLILSLLIVGLVSCGPKDNNETQTETTEIPTKPRPTTTAGPLTNGIAPEDDGWSYWISF